MRVRPCVLAKWFHWLIDWLIDWLVNSFHYQGDFLSACPSLCSCKWFHWLIDSLIHSFHYQGWIPEWVSVPVFVQVISLINWLIHSFHYQGTGERQKTPLRVLENSTQAFGKSHPGLGVHQGFWKIPPRVLEKCSDTTRI